MINKKGFGSVASTLIMFIAIVSVSTGLVISFKNYIEETQQSLDVQNDLTVTKLKTSLEITYAYYNSSSGTVNVYVKNVGETRLRPTKFDLFIDEAYYSNFSRWNADNLSESMVLFAPQQTLLIQRNVTLSSGTHDVRVVTEYGTSVEDSFNN